MDKIRPHQLTRSSIVVDFIERDIQALFSFGHPVAFVEKGSMRISKEKYEGFRSVPRHVEAFRTWLAENNKIIVDETTVEAFADEL